DFIRVWIPAYAGMTLQKRIPAAPISSSLRRRPESRHVAVARDDRMPTLLALHDGAGGVGDLRGGEAEVLEHLRPRRRGAEVGEADEAVARAQPLVPALGDAGLDGDARRRAEHVVAVGFGLGAEQLERRQRDDSGVDA